MDVKSFRFADGSAVVSVENGLLTLKLTAGRFSRTLTARGTLNVRPVSALPEALRADLLSGRIAVETTADGSGVTLHTNPVRADGAPFPALMVHYRVEAIGDCALRFTCWFGSREPLVAGLQWLPFTFAPTQGMRLRGFFPDYDAPVDAVAHSLRFGASAVYDDSGFLLLSDGDARFFTDNQAETPLCSFMPVCGAWEWQNLADFDETHPLTAVLSWGEGLPLLPTATPLLPAATLDAPTGALYTLQAGRLTVGVTAYRRGASLNAVRLSDFGTASLTGELARLVVKNLSTGEVRTLSAAHDWNVVRVRKLEAPDAQPCLSIYLAKPRDMDLAISVELRAEAGDTVSFRTKVLNTDENWTVLSAAYPQIRFTEGRGASFFQPTASGIVTTEASARQYHWNGIYPSGFAGVCPVFGVYQPEKRQNSGLYVAIHAEQPARTDMNAAFWKDGSGQFTFDYAAENMGRPANAFSLNGALVLTVLDGDWYDMACLYDRYVSAHARWLRPKGRPDSPQWMREVPLYVMDWMPNDNPDADPVPVSVRPPVEPPRDNWYRKPCELADRLGLPIGYHLYNWHFIPFNNDYPYYFPVKEGLEAGVEELHRHGVHVMPYINGRIVDTRDSRGENIRFDRDLAVGATRTPAGELNLETYASHEPDGALCRLAAMCPTAPVWRKMLAEIAFRLFNEYHMDAIYVDQVAAARPNPCCASNHGHTPGGGDWWGEAYRLLMERLRQEAPAGCGFTTECHAEGYADQFDGLLTWGWIQPGIVPFCTKFYSGRVSLIGRNTNGYKKPDAQYFRFHVAQAVMFGQVIGWTNADVIDDPDKSAFLLRLCHMRWDVRETFNVGDMLRPPQVTGSDTFLTDNSMNCEDMQERPCVVASGWRHPNGRRLLLIANSGKAAATVTLTLDAAEYAGFSASAVTAYGEAALEKQAGLTLVLRLSGESALTLLEKA